MEPLQPGVHHFGAAPRVTAERQSSDDVQIPRERPTPRRLDFGEQEPKRPRTDRVRVGYIVRHPRPPTGDLCQRLRMRITVDGNERGTISGTIVYLRRLRAGANLHRALYEHRQATHDLHEVGLVLWTASGRARDDILEASASVEARGAWLHVETIDVDGECAAEALAQTLRRCGCAAATHVARPALATAVAPLEDESSGEEDTENHAAACAAVGFARSTRSPEALWVVTQETLYHDAARLDPAQAARRVRREDRRAAERIPRRSVVPPTDAGLRDALRAFDPSLLDEDAERSLCRECCQRVHDQGADPDAAGALHVAVALKSPRLVACLVDDCGADPNHRFDGATPLMNCAEGLSYSRCDFMRTGQVAELLLERGADAAATDLHGRTALGRLVDRMGGVDDERALFDRHRLGVPVFLQRLLAPAGGPTAADADAARRASGLQLRDVLPRLRELGEPLAPETLRLAAPLWICGCGGSAAPDVAGGATATVFRSPGKVQCLACVARLLGGTTE